MPRYRIVTYFFEEEYPSGACFLVFFDDFAVSQDSFGCAAGFASESDKTIGSAASCGVRKSTLVFFFFFVLFFVCFSSVTISMSESGSGSSVGLSGRGGSLVALGVMAILSLGVGFGAGFGVTVVLVALAVLVVLAVLVALAVGAKVSLVCCGPGELVPLAVATLVCLDLSPPRGDASFPLVLVGFRLLFGNLVMVTCVASVRCWT